MVDGARFPFFFVFLHWGLCAHTYISILITSKFCRVGVLQINYVESNFAYTHDSTNLLNCGCCNFPKADPQYPPITAITDWHLTKCAYSPPPINHNNEADQTLNTFINMWCTYIYTHIYSVHSMMVWVLPTCVLLSGGWGVKEGFPPCFWVTHVFVWHLQSVLFPSLPASLPPPHLLFITTIPPLLTETKIYLLVLVMQAHKPAL